MFQNVFVWVMPTDTIRRSSWLFITVGASFSSSDDSSEEDLSDEDSSYDNPFVMTSCCWDPDFLQSVTTRIRSYLKKLIVICSRIKFLIFTICYALWEPLEFLQLQFQLELRHQMMTHCRWHFAAEILILFSGHSKNSHSLCANG